MCTHGFVAPNSPGIAGLVFEKWLYESKPISRCSIAPSEPAEYVESEFWCWKSSTPLIDIVSWSVPACVMLMKIRADLAAVVDVYAALINFSGLALSPFEAAVGSPPDPPDAQPVSASSAADAGSATYRARRGI